jgi:hypothetical protein
MCVEADYSIWLLEFQYSEQETCIIWNFIPFLWQNIVTLKHFLNYVVLLSCVFSTLIWKKQIQTIYFKLNKARF